jgi:hypothetical protein
VTARTFDPARDCGARSKRTGLPCRNVKGFHTAHVGAGHCWLHGGATPNGKRQAARQMAEQAIAKLGLPIGSGDPFMLLTKTVQHAEGHLEATAHLLQEAAAKVEAFSSVKEPDERLRGQAVLELVETAKLYAAAIRTGGLTGKEAVDADVADRMVAVETRRIELLQLAVQATLDRMAVEPAWREKFQTTLGEELLTIAVAPTAVAASN